MGRIGALQGTSTLERSDAEIIRAVLAGEQDLYGLLFARYRLLVINFVTARIGKRAEAEAVAQDAFVRAYRSLDKLTNPDRFSSWLLRIAGNLSHDWLKEQARAPRSLDQLTEDSATQEAASTDTTPSVEVERRELGARIGVAISDLEEPYRTTASLRYIGARSCAEIAQILDLEIGTVTMRLSRANRMLRELLIDLGPDSAGPKKRPGSRKTKKRKS